MNASLKDSRILIVDDNTANLEVLEDFLMIQGYSDIRTTSDPREVYGLVAGFKPELILLDLMMPHMSGFEVMEQLKSNGLLDSFLPILVLTADVTEEAKKRALSGGASDFLTKPFDLTEAGLRIRNLLYSNFLYQQVVNQNLILEEKVKERTLELVQKNEELQLAKEKAEAGDKLKTAFINTISHEIRTPLNGIIGFGQILVQPDISAEEREEYLQILKISSDRLIKTVTDYMDTSLIVTGNMTSKIAEINVSQFADELYEEFLDPAVSKNLHFELSKPKHAHEIVINSDYDKLRKSATQILDNAIKFTRQGSVTFGYALKGHELEFFIRDTGIGMDENESSRIFQYFMQADYSNTRLYEGSGLGLFITRNLIESLGGTIRFESVKNQGTVFIISIPA